MYKNIENRFDEMKRLSNDSKNKLYQLIKILDEFVSIGTQIERSIPKVPLEEFIYVRINLMSRYVHRIESINLMLSKFEENPTIEDSIGLLIRGGLADFIPMLYLDVLHTKIESPTDEINNDFQKKMTRSFLCDHIYNLIDFLKKSKDNGVIGESYYRKQIDKIKTEYSSYFFDTVIDYNNPFENIDSIKFHKNYKLMPVIRNSPISESVDINFVNSMYSYYSKYEHFGVFTNRMQTQDMGILMYQMFDSIRYLMIGSIACCIHLSHKFQNISEENLVEIKKRYDRTLEFGR